VTLVKCIAVILALAGLVFGIASAYFWWRSSQEEIKEFEIPPIITGAGGPVVTSKQMQDYLQRVSGLNAKAAFCGAIGVSLGTVAGVLATLEALLTSP